jgi:transitional endoplasmic reticulum ATPase
MLTLKVYDAYPKDVGKGIARIDHDARSILGLSPNDIIEIVGKRRTVARYLPLESTDGIKGIIRMDEFTRDNANLLLCYSR